MRNTSKKLSTAEGPICSRCGALVGPDYVDYSFITGEITHRDPRCASPAREAAWRKFAKGWDLQPANGLACIDIIGSILSNRSITQHINQFDRCNGLPDRTFDHARPWRVGNDSPWTDLAQAGSLIVTSEPYLMSPHQPDVAAISRSTGVDLVAYHYPGVMLHHPAASGETDSVLLVWLAANPESGVEIQ